MGLLEGKVGFVTGAGHGQRRTHAVRMAEEGADVILCDICAPVTEVDSPMSTFEELTETARLVEKTGRRAVMGVADVRDRAFDDPLFRASAANMLPIPLLQPQDVSNAVVWLMSDQAKWISGVTLPVDAGNTNKP